MRVTFLVPSPRRPVGGVLALYEFANALRRRGHAVHLAHGPGFPDPIGAVTDITWFRFAEGITHSRHDDLDVADLPEADVTEVTGAVFFTDGALLAALESAARPALGRPFLLVQAYRHLPPATESRAFSGPWPKICIAHWMIDALAADGVPAADLAYVPYGLDHDVFRVTAAIDTRPLRVAMLYNAHPNKGAPTGLAALARVQARRPGTEVVIFGSKPPEHEIPESMTFVQSPPRTRLVEEIYNGSRVFVSPSGREGFGFCGIEAMGCGAALVSTDNGGSRDYAIDGETALVVPPGDVDAMADAVLRLLDDDRLRVRLAVAGRDFVRRFDWNASGERLERLLLGHPEG
ncbi:MAG: glycosyltransferase family 4 protein [Actinomycetota bacterium]